MKYLSFCILIFLGVSSYGQRPYHSLSLLNPTQSYLALSGYHGGLQTNLSYRNQWPGIPSKAYTYNLGIDGYVEQFNSGIGMNVFHDRIFSGLNQSTEIQVHIAPKFELSENTTILTSVALNYTRQFIDYSQFTTTPWSDPYFTTTDNPFSDWWNASAGLGLIHKNTMVLVQSFYLTQFDATAKQFEGTERRMPRTYQVYVSQRFTLSPNIAIVPSLEYSQQGELGGLRVGAQAQLWNFTVGSALRVNDVFSAVVGYTFKERVMIAYGYDITVSSLATQSLGSHELGIRATLFKDKAKRVFYEDLPLL